MEVRSQKTEVRMWMTGEWGWMNGPAKTFEDLLVWQKAHQFVLAVYRLTGSFPKHELYGLASQFRRAAVSIAANIAEGFRKRSKPDKVRFLNIAQGYIEECRYYLILTNDLEYGDVSDMKHKLQEVSKLLESYSSVILSDSSRSVRSNILTSDS